jgi:ornithine cyclodeaminase/alanine dehydrogenase-like protein (mu-crystallin family)
MARASVVTDFLAQCATMGDLHHAISAGRMTPEAVHAELGDLILRGSHRGGSPQAATEPLFWIVKIVSSQFCDATHERL